MGNILQITAPIYLLIGLGFLAVRLGVVDRAATRVLGRFVVLFCVPSLLFHALTSRDFGEVLQPVYLLAYLAGTLLVMGGALLYARRARRQPLQRAAMWGMGTSVSNSAFMGFPLVLQLAGPQAAVGLAMCMLVENLVALPLGLALADREGAAGGWRAAVAQSLRGLARNPMIIAIAAGMAFGLLGWRPPLVADKALQMLAAVASPVALFVVGGTLVGLPLRGVLRDAGEISAIKLLLHPLAVLLCLALLPPLPPALALA
ncbi:MAG: AEC family transporter, partial [Comamonas sp.]